MAETKTMEPEEARQLLASGEAGAIDLRDPEEVAKGHAPAAVPVLEGDLEAAVEQTLHGRDIPLLVFGDDEDAIERLREAGHDAIVVEGGWERWEREGWPVLPRSDEEYEGPELMMPGVTGGGGGDEEDQDEGEQGEDTEEAERGSEEGTATESAGPEGEARARHEEPLDSEAREEPSDEPAQEPRE